MRQTKHNFPARASEFRGPGRTASGQGLIEASAGLVVISLVFVLLTCFAINTYSYMVYGSKLQIIANEVAKTVNNRTFWLGAKRPLFQRTGSSLSRTHERAQAYSDKLADMLGLPSHPVVEFADAPDESVTGVAFTKVTVSMPNTPLPYKISSVFPEAFTIRAFGIASEATEAPPAFIRLGFKLINNAGSDPTLGDQTQVCMIPAYGFQTDYRNPDGTYRNQNLGGTENNGDVVGNQPNAQDCLWAGINASPMPLRSDAPYISGPNNQQVRAFY